MLVLDDVHDLGEHVVAQVRPLTLQRSTGLAAEVRRWQPERGRSSSALDAVTETEIRTRCPIVLPERFHS